MIIEIPDDVLENELWHAFRKMPPTKNINPKNKRRCSPVLHQIGHKICRTGDLCITMVIIYGKIREEIENRGIIIYDPESETWQGVDYYDD